MCDLDGYPSFYNETTRRARKEHVCCACNETIRSGDRYVVISGKWDEVETYKQCARCNRVMHDLSAHLPSGWGEGVVITLDCDADPLEPGENPGLDALAFATRDEMQAQEQG